MRSVAVRCASISTSRSPTPPRACSPQHHRGSPSPGTRSAASSPSRCGGGPRNGSPASPCSTRSARPPHRAQLEAWAQLAGASGGGRVRRRRRRAGQPPTSVRQRPDTRSSWSGGWSSPATSGRRASCASCRCSRRGRDDRPWLGDDRRADARRQRSNWTRCARAEIQAELAAAIPGAEHVTIDGAGHMSPLDHPEAVAAALRTWLRADRSAPKPMTMARPSHRYRAAVCSPYARCRTISVDTLRERGG